MEDDAQEPFEEHLEDRKNAVLGARNKLLNRLWIGNGGGAAAVLTSLHPQQNGIYLIPLSFFVIGIMFLGWGSMRELKWIHAEIKSIEDASQHPGTMGRSFYLLSMPNKFFRSASEETSFKWTDWGATTMFLMGVLAGFVAAFRPIAIALWASFLR